jgi:hypothetical protein
MRYNCLHVELEETTDTLLAIYDHLEASNVQFHEVQAASFCCLESSQSYVL